MKDKIIQSAIGHIEKYGFRKFTIDNIASDLGISKKTIYKYFESKNQIISAVIDFYLELEKDRILVAMETEGGWIDKFKEVVFCHCEDKAPEWLMEELKRYFPEEWARADAMREFMCAQVGRLIKQGVEKGDIRSDIHPAIIGLAIEKIIDEVYELNFIKQYDMTINQALEEVEKLFLYGILKRE